MIKTIGYVMIFTVIGKLLGFIRELLLSYYFGASGISDAYLISQTIPGTIFQFVGTGLATCFIPVFYSIKSEKGIDTANNYTNKITTIILLFSTIVIVLIWCFTYETVKIFASGFEGENLKYAIIFTRIGICTLYVSTLIYVYNSYLQANEKFMPTAFSALPYNIAIIIAILLGDYKNIYFLAIGSAIATVIQLICLIIPMLGIGYFYKPNFRFKDKYIKKFFMLLIPVIMGVSVNEINILVDRTIASQIAVGGISALTYANSLIMFIQGGLSQSIITVCYPKISSMVTNSNFHKLKKFMKNSIIILIILLLPISMWFVTLSSPIVNLLFGRGAFDKNAMDMTQDGLKFYAIGIPFLGIRELLSRYFYAFEDTKTPMKNSTIGVFINICFNIIFSRIWGIGGLAFATTFSAIITSILLWIECKTKIKIAISNINFYEISKIIFANIIMTLSIKYIYTILPLSDVFKLSATVIISSVIYITLLLLMRVEICVNIKNKMKI